MSHKKDLNSIHSHELFMLRALAQAKLAEKVDEVPVGAVVVYENNVIAEGHNCPISSCSPVAHAEIEALLKAAKFLKNYRLTGATLYVSLEPCLMCYGAMVHARIDKCVFGAYDSKSGVVSTGVVSATKNSVNHTVKFFGGVLQLESKDLLQNFFRKKRN